jgi:hypothetical protein
MEVCILRGNFCLKIYIHLSQNMDLIIITIQKVACKYQRDVVIT